jgi:hypothetical protein
MQSAQALARSARRNADRQLEPGLRHLAFTPLVDEF